MAALTFVVGGGPPPAGVAAAQVTVPALLLQAAPRAEPAALGPPCSLLGCAAVPRGRAAAALAVATRAASRFTRRRWRRRQCRVAAAAAQKIVTRASPASRIVAVVGRDGAGKSKVCAALLELAQPDAPAAASPDFADKGRLLEMESAEGRRNFTCYNHFYSQQAALYHKFCPRLHLVDTPGHMDRLVQVDEALRVAHGAVVVCSVRGVGLAGTASNHIFAAVQESRKPMVIFLNGVDTSDDAADFELAMDSLEEHLGVRPVVLFAPVHAGGAKTGSLLLNVLDGTVCSALECSMGLGSPSAAGEAAPSELTAWAEGLREQFIDALSAADDELMEVYLEHEGQVPRPAIDAALRRAAAAGRVVPLVAGSAKSGLGVDALQEVIQTFIPADTGDDIVQELGVKPSAGTVRPASQEADMQSEPFLGWVFGRRQEAGRCLLHIRVLRGLLRAGRPLKVAGHEAKVPGEPFSPEELYVHGSGGELEGVLAAGPGDLVFVPAHTKSVPKGHAEFLLADATLPYASLKQSTEGQSGANHARQGCCTFVLQLNSLDRREQERLLRALETIREDDAGLRVEAVPRTGETLLTCMGMLHLELLRERLGEEFKILRLPLGKPHVEYRATLKEKSRATGQHQLEGKTRIRKGQVHKHAGKVDAWARVEVEPARRGSGVDIEAISAAQCQALQDGIRRGLQTAGPSGVPVVDVRVRVLEAEAQSEEAALEAATSAVQKAVQDSQRVVLLEPIVDMEVDVPSSAASSVLDDIQHKRRGFVSSQGEDGGGGSQVIGAEVPLREIRGFSGDLQKLTGGAGHFTFQLQGYREVLPQVEKQILEEEIGAERQA
uniref:Elongation factor EFG domain-containing protein n=1 Tax=Alexandrium monilatum TaxID=311494 RepID=A0A7S4PV37_9DINO|mmetsp:Transcript_63126/g.197664  ORF Transcript_63126/g.197664 Transcript_63126/m.197664 type:complete len:836 (+) Transcript_63126:91-2598(+)